MMMAHGVNTRDCDGWTPLHHAIHKNLPKMAEKILENGADPKANCRRGISSRAGDLFTPLQFAVMSKQHHVVKLLLKFHDDPGVSYPRFRGCSCTPTFQNRQNIVT